MSEYDQWQTNCPRCGAEGSLIVTDVTLHGNERIRLGTPLCSDGFEVNVSEDIKDCSTEDEKVVCSSCHQEFDLSDLEIEKGSPYTVVGFYSDNDQPFVEHRRAESPRHAADLTKLYRKGSEIAVVEVFEGHMRGCLENEEVES